MKKIFASVMAVVMAAVVLAGCGNSAATTEGDAADYGEGYVFKHGFDQDYPPYSYIGDDGETTGFDVELAKAVADYYGWEYQSVPFNWDAKDAELQAGSCDCIWSGFTKNGREDDYLWSKSYSDNTQMILVKKDSGIKTLDDLAGKKVGVQTSTSAYDMLAEDKKDLADTFDKLEVYETYTIAFNDLKAGAIDAIAIDVTAGNHLTDGETDYEYLAEELGNEEYAIGFRQDDTELCDKVNAALDALAEDGTVAKIAAEYPEIEEYITLGK